MGRLTVAGVHEHLGEGHHLVVVILVARTWTGEPVAGGDALDARWLTEPEWVGGPHAEALLGDARAVLRQRS